MISPKIGMPRSEAELDGFLVAFKGCTIPKTEWTHAAHVLAGSAYVHALGEAAALETMRARVKAYNLSIGGQNTETSGYHETLTAFWIAVFAALLAETGEASRVRFVQDAVERFGQRSKLHEAFYSFDVVESVEARRMWVAPERDVREAVF